MYTVNVPTTLNVNNKKKIIHFYIRTGLTQPYGKDIIIVMDVTGCNSASALERVSIVFTLSRDIHPSNPVRKVYKNARISLQLLRVDGVTMRVRH